MVLTHSRGSAPTVITSRQATEAQGSLWLPLFFSFLWGLPSRAAPTAAGEAPGHS